MKRFLTTAVLLGVVLTGCGKREAPGSAVALNPSLTITSGVESIPLDRPFPVLISVEGVVPHAEFRVILTGVAGITPDRTTLTMVADRQGNSRFELSARVDSPGHASLVASALIEEEIFSDSLEVVFDVQGVRFAAQGVGASSSEGRAIDIMDYFAAIPSTSDPNYVMWYELGDPGLAALSTNGAADLPTTLLVDDIQYMTLDGMLTEPVSAIEYFLPDTGGGVPLPGEIEGIPPGYDGLSAPPGELYPQANCGSAPTYVNFRQTIDGVTHFMPQGTYIRAVDYNGALPDRILAEGFIGANGRFSFNLNICDTSSWFDRSAPDVYFILETRTNNGLTASHGTFTRRHWWRTGTYFNYSPAAIQNMTITVTGANAEARNTQRIWHKTHQVRDWERSATGVTFPADILYPVSDYMGIADASRAFIGQMQIVYAHALYDSVLFHEYGHLVYYRNMLGATNYNSGHACNITANCIRFPFCGGCLYHDFSKDIGPEAAMIEGWADFFEALTTRHIDGVLEGWNAERKETYYPAGLGSEVRVANYLWDLWDTTASVDPVWPSIESTAEDPISPTGNAQARYKTVLNHFQNMPLSSELRHVWLSRIKPSLNAQGIQNHCAVLRYNTLGAIDSVCN
jgi:hypothetical protein